MKINFEITVDKHPYSDHSVSTYLVKQCTNIRLNRYPETILRFQYTNKQYQFFYDFIHNHPENSRESEHNTMTCFLV